MSRRKRLEVRVTKLLSSLHTLKAIRWKMRCYGAVWLISCKIDQNEMNFWNIVKRVLEKVKHFWCIFITKHVHLSVCSKYLTRINKLQTWLRGLREKINNTRKIKGGEPVCTGTFVLKSRKQILWGRPVDVYTMFCS